MASSRVLIACHTLFSARLCWTETPLILSAIREGIEAGTSSAILARQTTGRVVGGKRVGGYSGLTSEGADQVISARDILSDRRFDAQIRRAIREGSGRHSRLAKKPP